MKPKAGKITRGGGIQSFSRAFLSAGARINRDHSCGAWKTVPTADFMRVFYQHLGRGETRVAQALRSAKLEFLYGRIGPGRCS